MVNLSSIGNEHAKHTLRSLWKIVENIFFLDIEHVKKGEKRSISAEW